MKRCPFCAEEIQDAAIVCTHCGRDLVANASAAIAPQTQPAKKGIGCAGMGCLGMLGFVVLVTLVNSLSSGSSSRGPTAGTSSSVSDAECRKTLDCWGSRNRINAEVACRRPIEALAKNNFEWTDGLLEQRMSHYRWKNESTGEITFIGDKIKFQNGFGAWIISTYECDMDASGQRVTGVRARPGQLPR